MVFFIILFFLALLALIPANIAKNKGRDPLTWWIYGTLFFLIALIHSLCLSPTPEAVEKSQLDAGMKKCPRCAEMVKQDAQVCRYCQGAFTP